MKQIQAYIKKHKLNEVVRALRKVKSITGLSVINRRGFGRGWVMDSITEQDSWTGVKIEIYCSDDVAEDVVTTIEQTAHTGLKGDGKIYVSSIEQAVRISTGERGDGAV
jgi:nitrogen regulatory protein PII